MFSRTLAILAAAGQAAPSDAVSLGSTAGAPIFTVMPTWLQYLTALAILFAIAPLVAMLAMRQGRRIKGGFLMAGILLGFGEAVDPRSKHRIEAQENEHKGAPENDEPVEPVEP